MLGLIDSLQLPSRASTTYVNLRCLSARTSTSLKFTNLHRCRLRIAPKRQKCLRAKSPAAIASNQPWPRSTPPSRRGRTSSTPRWRREKPSSRNRGEFTYVLIPHEAHKPMVEYKHPKNTTLEDDDLREALKLHFSQSGTLTEDQLAAYCLSLKQQIHAKDPECEVRDRDLLAVAHGVSVDTFALTVPDKQHQHAVSLYCDDKGHAKNAPVNERACGLARACGHADQQFRGDCFVSRYFDDEDAWLREDFRIEDCSSDAQWVKDQKSISKKSPGGMASLSDMYAKLGQANSGQHRSSSTRARRRSAS